MITLGEVVIIGGGCYGAFYTGQLEAAADRGALQYRRLVVVDHDPACKVAQLPPAAGRELVVAEWGVFLDRWLEAGARDTTDAADMIVPSPFMPHLMAEWLVRRGRELWPERDVALVPARDPMGTPFDQLHPSGVRFVSHADWLCPTHCIEPLLCPAIRAPRTWEMGDTVREWTAARAQRTPTAGPVLFTCRHVVHGVGMYPARLAIDGLATLRGLGEHPAGGDLVIGSVSACHGAVALLHLGAGTS